MTKFVRDDGLTDCDPTRRNVLSPCWEETDICKIMRESLYHQLFTFSHTLFGEIVRLKVIFSNVKNKDIVFYMYSIFHYSMKILK